MLNIICIAQTKLKNIGQSLRILQLNIKSRHEKGLFNLNKFYYLSIAVLIISNSAMALDFDKRAENKCRSQVVEYNSVPFWDCVKNEKKYPESRMSRNYENKFYGRAYTSRSNRKK